MPVTVAPNRIELSQSPEGFMPDAPEADVPPTGLPDVLNLLPDRVTDGLTLRPGYSLFSVIDPAGHNTTSYECHYLFYFEAIFDSARHKYLIAILTTNVDAAAANEMFVVYDFDTATWTWKANFTAPHAGYEHWGGAASNIWYGGTGGLPMYSWDPNLDVFTADAAAQGFKEWVTATSFADNTTESPADFAFKENQKVIYTDTNSYSTSRGIRYDKWVTATAYKAGDKVSRWATHLPAATDPYWKSFKCIVNHTAAAANAPATGASWATNWTVIQLDNPVADDNETSGDWYFLPEASQTIIGTFHGYRLFLRRHDSDNWSWVQYSAPFKPEKGEFIPDLSFDPTDWSAATDDNGDGGGWIPLREGDGDAIRAFQTFGSYLVIFKRWKSFVIAGLNESTWNVRNLDPEVGTVCAQSTAIHGGLVYFLSPTGAMFVTDGTRVEPAVGAEKVRAYINERLDLMMASDDDVNWLPTMTTYQDFIWITLSSPAANDDVTLVYQPTTGSFWPTNLPALDIATGRIEGRECLWFVPTVLPASAVKPRVFQLLDDPDDDTSTDITKTGTSASGITWRIRYPWIQFGTTRQNRRLRRLWALLKGIAAQTVVVKVMKNYDTDTLTTTTRTLVGGTNAGAEYIEGLVGTNDVHSVGVQLSGTATEPISVSGVGIDTEPRRSARFHI